MKISPGIIISGVILAIVIILSFVYLSATGHDTAAFVGFISNIAVAVPALAAWSKSQQAAASSKETVTNTNGRMTELTQGLADLVKLVSDAGLTVPDSIPQHVKDKAHGNSND